MTNVLVLGAGGNLGGGLVKHFSAVPEYNVSVPEPRVVTLLREPVYLDTIMRLIETHEVSWVINASAMTNVNECQACVADTYASNAVAAGQVALACRLTGTRLIHVSTDFVFSGNVEPGNLWTESDYTSPVNHYGASKLLGEKLIKEIHKESVIVRTAWLFGSPRQKTSLDQMLTRALDGEPLVIDNQRHASPTYIPDLCAMIQCLIEQYEPGFYAATYHTVNTGDTTLDAFFTYAQNLAGIPISVTVDVDPDHLAGRHQCPRPLNTGLSNLEFENRMQYEIPTWQDALARAVRDRQQKIKNSS